MNPLSPLATMFVLVIGVILPYLAWRGSRRALASADGPAISRRSYYISAFTTQVVALGFALLVAREIDMELLGPFRVEPLVWLATAAVIGGLLATLPWRWRTRTPAQKRRQALFAPRTPAQALANVALCLLAGVGEELVYRRVLHECVWWATGSWWLAAALCALSFGVAHAIQGRRSMLIVAGVAFWMHLTVLWTGSLHLAIVVHAVYDLIATFTIARWVKREGVGLNVQSRVRLDTLTGGMPIDPPGPAPRRTWPLVVALAALCVTAFVLRWDANRLRVSAGHGDVSAYYQVARNLAQGRGFVQDYVADFLNDVQGVPAPSNTWWLPLPSIISAGTMLLTGDMSYTGAKLGMLAVASLLPLVAFFAGLLLLRSRAAALACAVVGVGFPLWFDQPCLTLSHGTYGLFAGGALVILLASLERPRLLPLFGLFAGGAYMSRGDSQVLLLDLLFMLAVTHVSLRPLRLRRPLPWKGLLGAGALFVAVMAPWWIRNLSVLGTLMPDGPGQTIFARTYEDWYAPPGVLNLDYLLSWGFDNIWKQRVTALGKSVAYLASLCHGTITYGQAVVPGNPVWAPIVFSRFVLMPLLAVGTLWLIVRRRTAAGLLAVHLTGLLVIYAVLIPALAHESFRTSLHSIHAFAIALIVAGLRVLAAPLVRLRGERLRDGAVLVVALALATTGFVTMRPLTRYWGRSVEQLVAPFRHFGLWARTNQLDDEAFFCRNICQFSTESGCRAVMIPNGTPEQILEIAKRFEIHFLVQDWGAQSPLGVLRPALGELERRGNLVRERVPRGLFPIYRIRDPALPDPNGPGSPPR